MRQAYDYWQDQPGNYLTFAAAPHARRRRQAWGTACDGRGRTGRHGQEFSLPCKCTGRTRQRTRHRGSAPQPGCRRHASCARASDAASSAPPRSPLSQAPGRAATCPALGNRGRPPSVRTARGQAITRPRTGAGSVAQTTSDPRLATCTDSTGHRQSAHILPKLRRPLAPQGRGQHTVGQTHLGARPQSGPTSLRLPEPLLADSIEEEPSSGGSTDLFTRAVRPAPRCVLPCLPSRKLRTALP